MQLIYTKVIYFQLHISAVIQKDLIEVVLILIDECHKNQDNSGQFDSNQTIVHQGLQFQVSAWGEKNIIFGKRLGNN